MGQGAQVAVGGPSTPTRGTLTSQRVGGDVTTDHGNCHAARIGRRSKTQLHRVFDDGMLDALTLKWSHTVAYSLQANTIDFSIDGFGIANHPESGPLKQKRAQSWSKKKQGPQDVQLQSRTFWPARNGLYMLRSTRTQVGSQRKKGFKTNRLTTTTGQFNKRLSFTGQFCVTNVVSAISGNWR